MPAIRLTTHENAGLFFLVIYEMGDYIIWISENPFPNTFKINLNPVQLIEILPSLFLKNTYTYIFIFYQLVKWKKVSFPPLIKMAII